MTFQAKASHKKDRRLALLAIVMLGTGLMATSALAAPSFTFVVDTGGQNDQPGQKDLTAQASANDGSVFYTAWKWDDTACNGGNTGDGCSLLDTDANGFVDYAVCATAIGKDPVTLASVSVYSCTDKRVDRCSNPVLRFSSTLKDTATMTPSTATGSVQFTRSRRARTGVASDGGSPG